MAGHPHSRKAGIAVLALLATTPSCSETAAESRAAAAAFARFQDALFAGDRAALRRLVTRESAPVVGELSLSELQSKQPLAIAGVEPDGPDFLVRVVDPNRGDAPGTYVVVRQGGRLRVDLLATTALHHAEVPRGDGSPDVLPKRPSPAEIDRLRAVHPEAFR